MPETGTGAPDKPYSAVCKGISRSEGRRQSLMTISCCSAQRNHKAARLTALITAVAIAVAPTAAAAQNRGPPILRDTEAEQLLRDYTRPILRAAGLEKQNIQMVIINESSFNAFVADGRRIFVNYGAIMQSETPNQIIGVLAHETGHLAGGHLAKLREQLANAQTQMIIAMLLGAGAMVAGSRGGTRQQRPGQCRRGRDRGAAGNDPAARCSPMCASRRRTPTAPG